MEVSEKNPTEEVEAVYAVFKKEVEPRHGQQDWSRPREDLQKHFLKEMMTADAIRINGYHLLPIGYDEWHWGWFAGEAPWTEGKRHWVLRGRFMIITDFVKTEQMKVQEKMEERRVRANHLSLPLFHFSAAVDVKRQIGSVPAFQTDRLIIREMHFENPTRNEEKKLSLKRLLMGQPYETHLFHGLFSI